MIKVIGNNKLSVAGIKFPLPENFTIDIEGMETFHEDSLNLLPPDSEAVIRFMTTNLKFDSPIDSLMDLFFEDDLLPQDLPDMTKENFTGYKWIEAPHNICINNLRGAAVKYETQNCFYYEIHFERQSNLDRHLEVLVTLTKPASCDLNELLSSDVMKNFFDGFEAQ